MNAQPRRSPLELRKADIPDDPGVYAWYRDGMPIYVGKADNLCNRVWKKHLGRGAVMTASAFRRNVAEHLGIASADDIKTKTYIPTPDEVRAVRDFVDGCELAWRTTESKAQAVELETAMKREWRPPLTKR